MGGAGGDRESKNSGKGLPFFRCDLDREVDQARESGLSLNLELAGGEIEFGRERCGWGELDLVVGAEGEPAGEVECGRLIGGDILDRNPAELGKFVG